jgi:hypothetical protein
MMGRRSRLRPEEVVIDGFLLLDTGDYKLVTAHVRLDVFWKMKALDVVGNVRSANRARAVHPTRSPQIGSVWLVDADLTAPLPDEGGAVSVQQSTTRVSQCTHRNPLALLVGAAWARLSRLAGSHAPSRRSKDVGGPTRPGPTHLFGHAAHEAAAQGCKVFQMRIHELHALEQVAIERTGPRFIEALRVHDMLPSLEPG